MTNNWTEMFERRQPDELRMTPPSYDGSEEPEWAPPPDPKEYRPWIMQRGGRPSMFIDLRRFEPKTGTLTGCLMSYPALIAVDYIGDCMLALDFGVRKFVLEGDGLGDLVPRLQNGMVIVLQEFSPKLWNSTAGAVIRKLASSHQI
jgi:hypothetical protein